MVGVKGMRWSANKVGKGKTAHELFFVWRNMKNRCYQTTHKKYRHYGGRGITVCDRWLSDFWAFVADMGDRPEGLLLDRINNNGNYEPGNCRWADHVTSLKNRRGWRRRKTTPKI
jgi:hypothetical protein